MTSQVQVRRVTDAADVPHTLLEEMKGVVDRIRERAFSLFQRRGAEHGRDLEDWLQAERDVIGPSESELAEDGAGYHVHIALPGFEAKDVKVTATPNELIVKAENTHTHEVTEGRVSSSEFSSREIFRKFDFTEPVDAGQVTACLDDGTLEIDAVKAVQPKQIGKAA
jgi:HSP20 family molecular chaperone IbpA